MHLRLDNGDRSVFLARADVDEVSESTRGEDIGQ
jgi:hypothetical protein